MKLNLLSLFKAGKSAAPRGTHMTWESTSMGRTISRTGLFLRRQIWVWPIIATVVLSVLAFVVHRAIESTMQDNLRSELETLLRVETAMLEDWVAVQISNVEALANDVTVREPIYRILDAQKEGKTAASNNAVDPEVQIGKRIMPWLSTHGYVGYLITDKSKKIIAAKTKELLGRDDISEYDTFLRPALEGRANICPPFSSVVPAVDESGRLRTDVPTMFVCAPIRDADFQVVGALALRIRPESNFTRILQLGRYGASGETYAFDKAGLMVSNSRFDDAMILLGLLPDREQSRSILNVSLRDPQGDMTAGFRPKVRRAELPLTKMAASAVAGNSGIDLEGYRDYRGVMVVGAWNWLPKHQMGIATEIDAAEAFRPLTILKRTFLVLHTLLAVGSVAIFVFTILVARLRREAQKAEIEARHLGQYVLDDKLGAGGMGVVYKAHHAMLRRPTAIKMLDVDRVDEEAVHRFEREVQITCQLNHPNTVAIYDYGRTPEGVFYYAMEFLAGINLQTLVTQYGPQSEGRVIHILKQVCGSLFEAHSQGLVHRDIKPANIMLDHRGGEPDVVKVLDFGLVKTVHEGESSEKVSEDSLTGTPLYMAPESIQAPNSVDARSDLYAVGAVGYFLLTGKPVFEAASLAELCQQHIDALPIPPSQRLGRAVSTELEHIILSCLEKSRSRRPQTARDVAQLLAKCPTAQSWSMEEAEIWWGRHQRGSTGSDVSSSAPVTSRASFDRTVICDLPQDE